MAHERPIILPTLHAPDGFMVSAGIANTRYTGEQVLAFAAEAVREDRRAHRLAQSKVIELLGQVETLGVPVPLKMWLAAAGVDKKD